MKTKTIELDTQAKKLAADYIHTERKLLDVLMEMKENHSFRELDTTGIFDYCERVLKFSRAQSFYFKNVAEKSKEIPELKKAIDAGILSLSQARRIVPVITPSSHQVWIHKASTLLQQELEKEVAAVNPKSRPRESLKPIAPGSSKLIVEIDNATEENLKLLQDILSQKTQKPADLKSVIAWITKECREKYDPLKKAERTIALANKRAKAQPAQRKCSIRSNHQSQDKSEAAQIGQRTIYSKQANTAKNEANLKIKVPVSLGNKENFKLTRKSIPNSIKAEIVQRDGWQCTHYSPDGRRCTQKRWLDFHHLKEVSKGGLNEASNLTLRCKMHHKIIHVEATSQQDSLSWSYWWNLETIARHEKNTF